MVADSKAWAWYRRHTLAIDVAIVPFLILAVLMTPQPDGGGKLLHKSAVTVAFGLVACLAVIARSRWPLAALVVSVAAVGAVTLSTTTHTTAVFAAVFTLYTFALRTDRRSAVTSWVVTALVLVITGSLRHHHHSLAAGLLSSLAWAALATAVGDGVRNRRDYVASIQERASRAEQSLQEEARRQVAEERLRIARELHDVVAHHMAVVTVQAGVASHLLATDPTATAESLDHIKRAGRTVLDELSGIMTILREPGDSAAGTPSPGLDQLEDLIATFSAAGLRITLVREGRPSQLSPSVNLVAFRILQESLTNAHKHGRGTALATITYTDSWVTLSVTNPATETAHRSTGHGIIGMTERATAVGGQLSATKSGGSFTVHAKLPLDESDKRATA